MLFGPVRRSRFLVTHRTSYYLPRYMLTRSNTKLCYNIRRYKIVYRIRQDPLLNFKYCKSLIRVSPRRAVKVQTVSVVHD
jgi:hypothetical protein